MFASGLAFALPALLTTLLAGGSGVLFGAIAWIQLRSDQVSRTPLTMYFFAASVVINVARLPVILCLPYDVQNGNIFGVDAMTLIWSSFLVVSLVLACATIKLLSSYAGKGRRALKTGSIVLIVLYIFGFIGAFSSC